MLPPFLIQALFGLGGVCLLLSITVFHYFKDKVDQQVRDKMDSFFSAPATDGLLKAMKKRSLPQIVIQDFHTQLLKIGEPRRRFRSLLLFFPISGSLFMLSASLASVAELGNGFVTSIANMIEFLANSSVLIALVIFVYCAYQLARLARQLA